MRIFLLFLALSVATPSLGAKARVIGNPNAPKGGTFTIGTPAYPKSLLYYLAFGEFALLINSLTFDTLLDTDLENYEMVPLLAERWEVSKDKKTFTFFINPKARFSDGKPVTSADVKFTWDTIMNPKNKTAPFQAAYASIKSCEVVDKLTVKFTAKTLHFKNLEKLAGLMVLPKHFFSRGNFNRSFNRKLLGSGPYKVSKVERNKRITLTRNKKYWGRNLAQNKGRYNFDTIHLKTVPDYTVQFQMFKRGDIDYFYFLISKMWVRDTNAPQFKKNYIKKIRAENLYPTSTQGFGWNLRNPLFKDKRVRQALSHLMDRDRWIKELFYNQYVKSSGVVAVTSPYRHPSNKPLKFNPKRARQLLREAGWTKTTKDGVLIKDGKRFEFEIMGTSKQMERMLTMYQEELKKMGIRMRMRVVDWATALKLMDDWKFDAKTFARGRAVHPSDFEVAWGSKQADIKGSANFSGYKNKRVDELAPLIDKEFNQKKRMKMVREVEKIIAEDQPFSFTYEPTFYRLGYWNRFSFPKKGYFKYSNWRNTFQYWWYDKSKDQRLRKAIKKGAPVS